MVTVKVLGTGCKRCSNLEAVIRGIVQENKLDALVEKVTDYQEFIKYGIMASPGLIINEKVKSTGIIPANKEIINWILQETDKGINNES